jgi:hypothetical protein
MSQQNNPGQRDTSYLKDESEKQVVNDKPKTIKLLTPEIAATQLIEQVLRYQMSQVPMPEVRRSINSEASILSKNFDETQKKEFSLALRTKFERMKQFAEASHQEVISLTSQIGW